MLANLAEKREPGRVITSVETQRVAIALRERFRTAVRQADGIEALQVTVRTDDGKAGVGFATATPAITGDTLERMEAHIRAVLGEVVLRRAVTSDLLADVAAAAPASPSATAAVDMAILELLHQLDTLDALSVATSVTVSADTAEAMAASARLRLDAGFTVLKLKLGVDPDGDLNRIQRVAEAVDGRAALWVDANQGWTKDQALRILHASVNLSVAPGMVEQPVDASELSDLAEIAASVPMPVFADESAKSPQDIERIADNGFVAGVNVKLMKFGGVTAARRAITYAQSRGLEVLVGSMMEHPASVACAVRLAAELSPTAVHDLDAAWWMVDPSPCVYDGGRVYV